MGQNIDIIKAGFKNGFDKGTERRRKKKEARKIKEDNKPKNLFEDDDI